jgi:hypothetical protein
MSQQSYRSSVPSSAIINAARASLSNPSRPFTPWTSRPSLSSANSSASASPLPNQTVGDTTVKKVIMKRPRQGKPAQLDIMSIDKSSKETTASDNPLMQSLSSHQTWTDAMDKLASQESVEEAYRCILELSLQKKSIAINQEHLRDLLSKLQETQPCHLQVAAGLLLLRLSLELDSSDYCIKSLSSLAQSSQSPEADHYFQSFQGIGTLILRY